MIFASAFQMSLRGHRLESSNEKCLEIKLENVAGCDFYFLNFVFSSCFDEAVQNSHVTSLRRSYQFCGDIVEQQMPK